MPYVRASRPGTPDAAGPLGQSRPDLPGPDLPGPELPCAEQMSRHADVGGGVAEAPGLLTGRAGVGLALETARHSTPPRTEWDTCLLIT